MGLRSIEDFQPPVLGRTARALLSTLVLVLALVLALGLAAAPLSAHATPSLGWSAPAAFDSGSTPSAVSCASESLCVAVNHQGDALSTFDPTVSAPSWSTAAIDPGESLNAVSCATSGLCVAVDGHGSAFVRLEPKASAWLSEPIDGGRALTGVSCPGASLCVAVDESGNVLSSEDPGAGDWALANIDPGHRLSAVSCSSQSLCAAVDEAGEVLSSVNPTGGAAAWRLQRVDFGGLTAVSCVAAGPCVAGDDVGEALAGANPAAVPATWTLTPIDSEAIAGVSCVSSGLCVAVDSGGRALASDDPDTAIPSWSVAGVDSEPIGGVSCLPGGFCMAVDTVGRWLAGRVPAPTATTLAVTEASSVSATLAGAVDPNDAVLDACRFEYGTGVPYTQSVPCSPSPTASGGVQDVSAPLSGLAPNTTYHYRVLASSLVGAAAGADGTFTTAVSSQVALINPHPSITGTPAPGQLLTCHPGTPSPTTARLSYAWLRDLIPIPGATATTYTVKYQDSGHHLQCEVTATDGGGSVTAKSAFVTIPVGGVPASVGETVIGKAVFRDGKLSVPVVCSPHASGGCRIALRLTVIETLNGRRVVAIAARRVPVAHESAAAHGNAAALRHVTVTLASVRARLATGTHRTLTATLNATGRRLLAAARRLTAYLYVSGTVIGAIEAPLARQTIALERPSRTTSTHAARRR